eukprot:gene14447-24101_t
MAEEEVANFEMGDAAAIEEIDAGLAKQDLDALGVAQLTPLTHEVISRQATINIGTIGHVAHGKSTVVKAISGVKTVRFKKEMMSNITIKLGYANAKIFEIPDHPRPHCYVSSTSRTKDNEVDSSTGKAMKLIRHVSFVDCPGHDILMATMLNGAAVMDAALLLIAGNEPCPQPQTSEHLAAVDLSTCSDASAFGLHGRAGAMDYLRQRGIARVHPLTVVDIMARLDPEGVYRRSVAMSGGLQPERMPYWNRGPMDVLHMDSHDKLHPGILSELRIKFYASVDGDTRKKMYVGAVSRADGL